MEEHGSDGWRYRGTISPRTLPSLRRHLVSWLRRRAGDEVGRQADDVVLACWEAMANVLDHAYHGRPGLIDVRARIDEDVLIVTVADQGRWTSVTERADGGRGLRLIQALVDGLDLRSTDDGTVITLTWPFPARRTA
ncbi:ATP-binding protein [Amycolatopsis sp. NBC_01488]|uniref:ATP-binding protein n=1 Tax=Amycolatopsis sp. NBC_01488 TaxID=2903563 RepID=UPI002E2C9A7D|nr:ATP-binding protein [Amycolatopsis sp. NBC_01488]